MVETVKVEANYDKASQVPRIGQRKRMRVNGRIQTMTLNSLAVSREHSWDDDGISHVWWFNAQEVWGGFYDTCQWCDNESTERLRSMCESAKPEDHQRFQKLWEEREAERYWFYDYLCDGCKQRVAKAIVARKESE